jgi:GNAT superfamily N-acetyltransferase
MPTQAPPVIRDVRPDDAEGLQHVFRRSSLANEDDRPILERNPDALELPAPPVGDRVRVATVNDAIAGFATVRDLGDSFELVDLFVDPPWMRRGIGHALVADAMAFAIGRGRRCLEVTANPHALRFYANEGFVVDHDVETRFGPAPRMRLELAPD